MEKSFIDFAICKNCKHFEDNNFCNCLNRIIKDNDNCSLFTEKDNFLIEDKLKHLHSVYKDCLYIEDTKRIDVVLAVALSRKLDGIPLWLILVGPSGDMKSVQLNALEEDENVYVLNNLTPRTIVNGFPDKKKNPDLAPELNGKVIIIPDMAQILKLPPNDKAELWGQLRDLYDGYAGKLSGMGSRAKYSNLKVTLLAGSTPSIDSQILVHQDLGTRELIYRTNGNENKQEVMNKCFKNEDDEKNIKELLKKETLDFINSTELTRKDIPPSILEKISQISLYVSIMRATAEFDQYTHTLRSDVYPEEPTRIAKQLKRFYVCLKSLSKDYSDERALDIIWHIGKSSAFPLRIKVFQLLVNEPSELSTSQVADLLKIGKSTAQRELQVFWNLGMVSCRKQEISSYTDRTYDYWKLNPTNKFVKILKNE